MPFVTSVLWTGSEGGLITDTLDFVISGALVLDGSGDEGSVTDVGIAQGRITRTGNLADIPARTRVDGDGLVLAPGFIDMHSHSDVSLYRDPRGLSKLLQGITLEVTGNCGIAPAPAPAAATGSGDPDPAEPPPWSSFSAYLRDLQDRHPAVHVAPLAGHGAIRRAVMGDSDRPATRDELERQRSYLAEALDAGAFGLSTGLIYPPGAYTPTAELVALCHTLAAPRVKGLYFSHIRSEGDRLEEAVEEALTIGAACGVPVELSHHKASGPRNWGKTEVTLARVTAARAQGQDVTLDVYPYTASATSLSAILPHWALAGGPDAALERFADPDTRARILAEVEASEGKGYAGYDRTRLSGLRADDLRPLEGKTLAEAASVLGKSPGEALLTVLTVERLQVGMIRFGMDEADVRRVLSYPGTMIGTDGSAIAPDGPERERTVHPRTYGTFPRVLGHYVREEHVLTLPDAIRRMTELPAERLGLADRGRIGLGAWADLVLFDPARIADRATFEAPHQVAAGMVGVWVEGVRAADEHGATGERNGRILRRGA